LITQKQGVAFVAELKPSIKLQRLVIAIHFIAFASSFANALPLALKLAVAALIALNFKLIFPKLKIENRKLRYTDKLGWELSTGEDYAAVAILKSTVITTEFIFLHLKDKSAICIANDALNVDGYRQLIVKLKMYAD
jgi:toxin CptA